MSGPTNGDEVGCLLWNETTQYVPSLAAVITRGTDGAGLLMVYLPKRYAKLFTDEELQCVQAVSYTHLLKMGFHPETRH